LNGEKQQSAHGPGGTRAAVALVVLQVVLAGAAAVWCLAEAWERAERLRDWATSTPGPRVTPSGAPGWAVVLERKDAELGAVTFEAWGPGDPGTGGPLRLAAGQVWAAMLGGVRWSWSPSWRSGTTPWTNCGTNPPISVTPWPSWWWPRRCGSSTGMRRGAARGGAPRDAGQYLIMPRMLVPSRMSW
jgi:hypothetical protein